MPTAPQPSPPFDLKQCMAKFSASSACEIPPNVLTSISLSVVYPGHDEVAHLSAFQIDRLCCRGEFLRVMSKVSQELHDLSFALFDKNGLLRSEFVDNGYHKGSGTWGRELDGGLLLYIEAIEVKEPFRNMGMASWMVKMLMQSEYADPEGFVICCPTPVTVIASESECNVQRDIIVDFFRKNGFRRIGRTSFFAFALDIMHPSHGLSASDDSPGHPQFMHEGLSGAPEVPWFPITSEAIQARKQLEGTRARHYPVRTAIATSLARVITGATNHLQDATCQGITEQDSTIEQKILTAYTYDPISVRKRDSNGFSPLHLVAGLYDLHAVNALLTLPRDAGVRDDLQARDNADGLTPLEVCEHEMRITREHMEMFEAARWDGYPDNALRVVLALRRAAGEEIGESDEEYVRKRKWGCTCGQCAAGWLSPRMLYRLYAQAELIYDRMDEGPPNFVARQPLSHHWARLDTVLESIPAHIWPGLYESFYKAYRIVFVAIALVLKKPGAAFMPFPAAVLNALIHGEARDYADHWSQGNARFYFDKGGKVEYALDHLAQTASNHSPIGNSDFDDIIKDSKLWLPLPNCANDLDFVMVRMWFGLAKA